jgi:hypothetical protein
MRQGLLGLSIAIVLVLSVAPASAEARRRNWIPSGRYDPAIGDLWSFKCPPGGQFYVWADTLDDVAGTSNLDLFLEVVDSSGTVIGYGDENYDCFYTPTCGFRCPYVGFETCGTGVHTIAVGSYPYSGCTGGGGYVLNLYVWDRNGNLLTDTQTALGGGAPIKVPRWAEGIGKRGPIIDDQVIPTYNFPITDPTTLTTQAETGPEESNEERPRVSGSKPRK